MIKEHTIVNRVKSTNERVKVEKASYVEGFKILVLFSDNSQKLVDFSSFIKNKAMGFYSKYKKTENFKSFKIENGNVVWGKNWDLIFPLDQLYNGKIE